MAHLTSADKAFFKENGYLVVKDALSEELVRNAQDALWEGIEADREDPQTWIGAGPRSPARGSHPAISATLHQSPLAAMMGELVGEDKLNLNPNNGPGPALVYPSGDEPGAVPSNGHLDGYYTPTNGVAEGTVGYSTINVTIYVEDIEPGGGCFTLWPGSHRTAAEYFRNHSLLSIQGGSSRHRFDLGQGLEIAGPAGTACLWHGQLFHSGSKNCRRNIRMALIGRYARRDANDIRFETPEDMWTYWEGID